MPQRPDRVARQWRIHPVVPISVAILVAAASLFAVESESASATEVVRFYSDGADLIEVAEVTVSGGAVLSGGGARHVEIEGFDEVWFDPDFRASALRVRIDDVSFLELRGAVPERLVALLSTLTLR